MSAQDHPSEVDMLGDGETHLFLLRVWARSGDAADEERQWCGKLQEVVSTRGGYFGDLRSLVDLLHKMLTGAQPGAALSETKEVGEPLTAQGSDELKEN